MADQSFLGNIDTERVSELLNETQQNVEYFQQVTDNVVSSYTAPLDTVLKNIYAEVINVTNPSLDTLEKHFLELSNCLYFMAEQVERLGIYAVLSDSAYKEVYNKAYLDAQIPVADSSKKKTVAELTALAESTAIYESTVNDIYERAYKIVKQKIDAANTMVSTLSKTISKRLAEMQLTGAQPNAPRILTEG